MKAPALERTSAAKAGWLIVLLTVGWIIFFLVPWPIGKPDSKPAAIALPLSKLRQAGLQDYTDWEGLPEIFAVWADKAEWKDGETRFAYWHPVAKSYSYYFEATRVKGGYRFKEIAEPKESDHDWDESLGEDCPIRFYRSYHLPLMHNSTFEGRHVEPRKENHGKVKLDLSAPTISLPETSVPVAEPVPKH